MLDFTNRCCRFADMTHETGIQSQMVFLQLGLRNTAINHRYKCHRNMKEANNNLSLFICEKAAAVKQKNVHLRIMAIM